ncbi:hypothetical protein ACF3NS_14820 [Arsenicicoccus cauae]|uniref:hypothetical protein n=1 Tax=Arsenicicoccus cauae TaxID=2663847 RepID=UPI00370D5DD5
MEFLLELFTAAMLRLAHSPTRCEGCQSYAVGGGVCRHCGWEDPDYVPPPVRELSEEAMAARLVEPCTPTSDISTFLSPEVLLRGGVE